MADPLTGYQAVARLEQAEADLAREREAREGAERETRRVVASLRHEEEARRIITEQRDQALDRAEKAEASRKYWLREWKATDKRLADAVEALRQIVAEYDCAWPVKSRAADPMASRARALLDRLEKGGKGQLTRLDLEKMIEQREGTILKQQEMLLNHPAVALLREFFEVNDSPCRFDHHGYCQAHFLQDKDDCVIAKTRKLLKELEPEELRQVRGH